MALNMSKAEGDKDRNENALIKNLKDILNKNKDKRVIVVGTTCTGKSTFLKQIENAYDMDELLFPKLSQEEKDYVCQDPWTEEIGRTMVRLAKDRVVVRPGEPVFGTVVFDSDLVIELIISDELLRKRTSSRGVSFEDAKNMQKQIETEIRSSKIPVIEFNVG